jgi:hypothetical protein
LAGRKDESYEGWKGKERKDGRKWEEGGKRKLNKSDFAALWRPTSRF